MAFDIGFIFGTHNLNRNVKVKDIPLGMKSDFQIVDYLGLGANGAAYNVNHLETGKRFHFYK